ncbi:MAG: class I SAM-dependent methyltransferase [Planctomycetota bacterium]|nr:class I SAM-dependent methyltransferase [Planctomycetota bacterium]
MFQRRNTPDPAAVGEMFAGVAPRYDLLNRLLSADLDRRWRQRAAAVVGLGRSDRRVPLAACPPVFPAGRGALADKQPVAPGASGPLVVDVCTGTGDLAVAVLRRWRRARVVACDVCRPMLARAQAKLAGAGLARRSAVLEADALALPLADGAADAACCAFGVRNLADEDRGVREMVRLVRPGGRVVILEFHRPRRHGLLAGIFSLYFRRILPTLGGWISGGRHGGYAYLVRSIQGFGPPGRLADTMRRTGLADVRAEPLPGGVASLYVGERPRFSA